MTEGKKEITVDDLYELAQDFYHRYEGLKRQADAAHSEYRRYLRAMQGKMGQEHYGLEYGDVIEFEKSWGYRGQTRTYRMLVTYFGAQSPSATNFTIKGRLVKKDNTLGEREEGLYYWYDEKPVRGKFRKVGRMEDGVFIPDPQ